MDSIDMIELELVAVVNQYRDRGIENNGPMNNRYKLPLTFAAKELILLKALDLAVAFDESKETDARVVQGDLPWNGLSY